MEKIKKRLLETLTNEWQPTTKIAYDAQIGFYVAKKLLQELVIEEFVDSLQKPYGLKQSFKWRKRIEVLSPSHEEISDSGACTSGILLSKNGDAEKINNGLGKEKNEN